MPSQTNEQALEACIEKALTGTCREQLKLEGLGVAESNEQDRGGHLYWLGEPSVYDREFAIDRQFFWKFLEATQADELAKIKDRPNWQRLILERLNRKIQKDGILKVLKGGLRIDDAHLTLLYSQHYNAINPEVATRFEQNIFSVTRQVHYSQAEPLKSIDMVIFINGFPSKDIEEKFDSDGYRLLVVANKYLTGFDQPELSTTYVDKKLQGVLAVQALSRLNRCSHSLSKRKEDTFVLDFFNSTDDIKEAFDPFYTSTSLSKATDVNVLHDTKEKLDEVGVYEWKDVESFCTLYFSDTEAEYLSPIIDTCAARFDHELELSDDDKADFKIKAKQFVKIYAQLACIMPFDTIEWEKLHWFLKFLIPKLKIKDPDKDTLDELLESVDLSTYGLERIKLKESIGLDASDSELDPQNPNVRGAHGDAEPEDPLDEIIKAFNERWFAGWEATPEEQRIKFINIAQHVMSNPNYLTQVVDNHDEQNSRIALEKIISQAVSQERKKELDLYKRYAQDPEFKRAFDASIMRLLASQEISKVVLETVY